MPDPEQQLPPPWTLPDLVDFEFYLSADAGDTPPSVERKLRPALDALLDSPASPESHRRDAFRLWLEARRGITDPHRLPGTILTASLRTLTSILTVLSFLGGAGLVLALLERPTWSFNVQLFFAATVLLQLALLAALALGWAFRRILLGSASLSFLQGLILSATLRLSSKLDREGLATGAVRAFIRNHGRMGARIVFGISQFAGIAFNAGLLAAFFGCLLVLDVNFYWASTFGPSMDEAVYRISHFISLPWSWARPEWAPTLDAIQVRAPSANPLTWYPFLICSILVWGLLPRLILRLAAAFSQHRSLATLGFHQRHHRELWRRLTAVDIQSAAPAPTDGAIVLNWNGIEVDPGDLHSQVIRQLRLNPLETHVVGGASPDGDEDTLHQISQHRRENHHARGDSVPTAALVVLAESWGLVPKRMQDFHAKIRAHLPRDLPLHFLLLGQPAKDTPFTAPSKDDIKVWENFLDTLNDPNADLRPYRN